MTRNFGVNRNRDDFSYVYRPSLWPFVISAVLWIAILISVSAIWGIF